MISDLNIDWYNLTKADMYTIIRQTEEENAKLRNEVDNLLDLEHLTSVAVAYAGCDECGEYKQTMLRLFAENAKLRELVNGWNFCSKTKSSTSDDCIGCPLFIQTPHSYRCTRDERMRELRVKANYK